ncbi:MULTISPECIES: GtrA family protein [Mammaliicoccus]|uniref:GtrA family protein n=1 Tax=Mammaliicoccus TaxID=2803850 RepID=UPI0011C7A43C|nr:MULTISPECIES: GtrA family protein [Mammaliicoccus]MEB8093517.1 GtrA family protein [Mammaliicoccus lentus]
MLNKISYIEVIKFIIVGVINTLNYYIIYIFLLDILTVHYLLSHISAFIVSFILSYFLNCYFVYKVTPTLKKFIKFPLTQVINMGMQTILLFIFVQILKLNADFAPFIGLLITIPITFLLSKRILKD